MIRFVLNKMNCRKTDTCEIDSDNSTSGEGETYITSDEKISVQVQESNPRKEKSWKILKTVFYFVTQNRNDILWMVSLENYEDYLEVEIKMKNQ